MPTDDDMTPGLSLDHSDDGSLPVVDLASSPGRPVCPVHLVQMIAYAGRKDSAVTSYRCRVEKCTCTDQRSRGLNAVIPKEPQMCPRCNIACEVNPDFQSRFVWQLQCPADCGFRVQIPKFKNPPRQRRSPTDIMDV